VCSIMNGDASATLKSLIEVCGWGNSPKDYCSLFGLLSAGHLIYLLAQAGVAAATVIHNTSNGINISDHQTSSDLSTDMRSTFNNDVRSGVEVLGELLGGGKMGASLAANLSSEASFVEELFLECSQRLNELQFPLDVRFYSFILKLKFLFYFFMVVLSFCADVCPAKMPVLHIFSSIFL
jgi:hypothetical protein